MISYAHFVETFPQGGLHVAPHSQGRQAGRLAGAAATRIEHLINMKTTKALGLDMPPTLFAGADDVIE